jgi:hypothetical protein
MLIPSISVCTLHQVYVVDARKQRRAQRELMESRTRLPAGAQLRMVTWQELFRLLREPEFSGRRWASDLMRYLMLAGLDTFHGMTRNIEGIDSIRQLVRWRAPAPGPGFRRLGAMLISSSGTRALLDWRKSQVEQNQERPRK